MNPKVLQLLREAAEWRMIALLFEPPERGWLKKLAELSLEVDDPELKAAVQSTSEEASETLYHSTFGPGGPAAPREVSYQGRVLPGSMLGEVTGYYKAFAYDPVVLEAPDHVAVEAGFVAYMRMKEAFAVERGEVEAARITADAARQFVDDHLNAMAEPLATSLEASGILYLSLVAKALFERVGPRQPVASAPVSPEGDCLGSDGCFSAGDLSIDSGPDTGERAPTDRRP